MLIRAVSAAALACVVVLGGVAVSAAPDIAWVAAPFGALAAGGALLWARGQAIGDAAAKAAVGRRAGMLAGAVAAGGWLVLTAVVVMTGPAADAVLLGTASISGAVWLVWSGQRNPANSRNPLRAIRDRVLRVHQISPPSSTEGTTAPVWSCPSATAGQLPDTASLSTSQLCLAWQRTYFVLLATTPAARRVEIVGTRQRVLEEIERRDPEGFSRWLNTGARAGSDPGRYLARDR